MAYVPMTKPALGTCIKKSQIENLIDNDEALSDEIEATGFINGSFEGGSDPDPPTGWEFGTTWGSKGFDLSTPGHGQQAFKFTSSGSGGGELFTEGFITVATGKPVILSFLHYSSVANIHNLLELWWYDSAQSYLDLSVIYNDVTTNPTSWKQFIRGASPPTSARYAKIKITGASSDNATPGTSYWDGFEILVTHPSAWDVPSGISEITGDTTYSAWDTNVGSVAISLPPLSSSGIVRITIAAQLHGYAGYDAYIRCHVGTFYSEEIMVTSDTYVFVPLEILAAGLSGDQTLYMDLSSEDGGFPAYGKIDPNGIAVEIVNP